MQSWALRFPCRLDVKVQTVDKGYPRDTDDVFTGVPLDARNVFLYQGEHGPTRPCCHPVLPSAPTGWAPPFLAWAAAASPRTFPLTHFSASFSQTSTTSAGTASTGG